MRIAICDDLEADRASLRAALNSIPALFAGTATEVREYVSGEALLMETEDNGAVFDLIFLDIYMGGITGMDTAKELRQLGASAPVIFLTTSPDFAVESYEVNAAGYLLKPIQLEKLSALISHLLTSVERPRVCIQSGRRRRYVFLDDILFAESDNHSLAIHLSGGEILPCSEKLSDLAARLDGRFLRCHQSYLVNMAHVADVVEDFILKDGRRVPIRTMERREIADAYYRFFVTHTLSAL